MKYIKGIISYLFLLIGVALAFAVVGLTFGLLFGITKTAFVLGFGLLK